MKMVWLRLAAVTIAIVAVVDPAITSSRTSQPVVSIIQASADQDQLADRVSDALSRGFRVVRGRFDGAAGTILVGPALPDESTGLSGAIVGITPNATPVTIVQLDAPYDVPINTRIPVRARVAVAGEAGRTLEVTLRSGGAAVQTTNVPVPSDSAVVPIAMTFVPATGGVSRITAIARIVETGSADSASTMIDARESRYPVLFFDPRASWSSTFVRRAVESDPRFVVTSRVQTSRGVSSVSGSPPLSLRDASLDDHAAIVIGSPDQLTISDVAAVERYLRERGGRVVLLLDGRVSGNVNRLTGVSRWRSTRLESPVALRDSSGTTPLRARELAWPADEIRGMSVHVWSPASDSTGRPVVWSVPVGAGELFVSGALDAWHYRDPGASAFEQFWPQALSDLSASAPPPLEIELSRRVMAPGQEAKIRLTVRDVALTTDRSVSVRAVLANVADSTVRLWPSEEQGVFEGTFVAPADSGPHRIVVTTGSATESAAFIVDAAARPARSPESDAIRAFASSRGGFTIAEGELRTLPSRLTAAFQPVPRVETWYPMRSAWWLLPFTLLLGGEWWWRRRRGLA
jgi:hypothetical protein